MSNLFEDCSSFTEIDLSEFNTYKVKKMNKTFKKCTSLKKVRFPKCNISNVEEMNSLFDECNNLEEINFANFKGKNLKKYDNIFGSLKVNICKKKEKNCTNVRTNDTKIKNIIKKINQKNGFSTEHIPIVSQSNDNKNAEDGNRQSDNQVVSMKKAIRIQVEKRTEKKESSSLQISSLNEVETESKI